MKIKTRRVYNVDPDFNYDRWEFTTNRFNLAISFFTIKDWRLGFSFSKSTLIAMFCLPTLNITISKKPWKNYDNKTC